jgi:hypothetical protein
LNAENYFIIAQGIAGFTAGSIFSTNPSSATTDAVFKDGAVFINGVPDSRPGLAGITIDGVGTFRNALIVSTPSGVFGFNSGGALLFAYPAPAGFFLESVSVAPLTNSACPGCLYLTSESVAAATGGPGPFPNGNIYVIKAEHAERDRSYIRCDSAGTGTGKHSIYNAAGLHIERYEFRVFCQRLFSRTPIR